MENMEDEKGDFAMFSYSHAGRHTFRGMCAFFDSKSGLVLGFNLGPKKGPQIETLPCVSRARGPVSDTVLGPVLWVRKLV